MGRGYDIWRCEFEEFVRLKQRWCELLEAEAREEKEVDSKTEEDRPPASRATTPAASGDDATFAPEKVASRRQAVAEEEDEEDVVVEKPGVAQTGGRKLVDVAALEKEMTSSGVEELSFDASGVGTLGTEVSLGSRSFGEA